MLMKKINSQANTSHAFLVATCERIYDFLEGDDGLVGKAYLVEELSRKGILSDDPRIAEIMNKLAGIDCARMDRDVFIDVICENISILEQIFSDDVVIPNFEGFSDDCREMHEACKKACHGKVATYIPSLANQNPEHWGVSVCTVNGQRRHLGDTNVSFCIQSCSKPITYCFALEDHGEEKVHEHVGREPSGDEFNALKLNKQGRPHNPMINSGAIMMCSLIEAGMDPSDRFECVSEKWGKLAGGRRPGFSNTVYLSERGTADRNFALAYFMNENRAFPEGTNLLQTLEFYFQCCSLTMNTDQLSIVAATLANGGVNPLTGERLLHADTVRNCLSMMYSCGMYDYSGEFAFRMGLPGKSGVAGAVFVVIPNVMGICTFSPNLDTYGNSVRGVEFYKLLAQRFYFHNFDMIGRIEHGKRDPRSAGRGTNTTEEIIKCASLGDISALKRLRLKSVNADICDYDRRTPLHLAASYGHLNVVQYLCASGIVKDVNPLDRWGGTPWNDAMVEGFVEVVRYLETLGGKSGPCQRVQQNARDAA
jgi:glutaminase